MKTTRHTTVTSTDCLFCLFFFLQRWENFDDLPWLSVYTSGRIASSTKTSTNLHCTVAPLTVHSEFEHQISLNMFLGQRIAMHNAYANVMTTGNHVFAFRPLSAFVTHTPHRTGHPTRLLRRFGLLRHLWRSFGPHLVRLSSHRSLRTSTNFTELETRRLQPHLNRALLSVCFSLYFFLSFSALIIIIHEFFLSTSANMNC